MRATVGLVAVQGVEPDYCQSGIRWRRSLRSRGYAVAVIFTALVLGGGAVTVGLSVDQGESNRSAQDQPAAWDIRASTIPLGDDPYALTAKGDIVWVAAQRSLLKVEKGVVAARHLHPASPVGITLAAGALWTTSTVDEELHLGQVLAFAPDSGASVQTIRLPGQSPHAIDADTKGIFVSLYQGSLLRIHPGGDATSRVQLAQGITHLLVAHQAVWVSEPNSGNLWKVVLGPESEQVRKISLTEWTTRSCPQGSDSTRQHILLADPCAGKVWLVDPHTGAIVDEVRGVGQRPLDVAVGGGLIYVLSSPDSKVTVVDVGTGRVLGKVTAGERAVSVAAGSSTAWVANSGEETLTQVWVESAGADP